MLTTTTEKLPKLRRITAYSVNVTYAQPDTSNVKYAGLCSLVQTFVCLLLSYTSFMGNNFTPDVQLTRTASGVRMFVNRRISLICIFEWLINGSATMRLA